VIVIRYTGPDFPTARLYSWASIGLGGFSDNFKPTSPGVFKKIICCQILSTFFLDCDRWPAVLFVFRTQQGVAHA